MSTDKKDEQRMTTYAGRPDVLRGVRGRNRARMALALSAGLRDGELLNLTFADLLLDSASPAVIVRVGS